MASARKPTNPMTGSVLLAAGVKDSRETAVGEPLPTGRSTVPVSGTLSSLSNAPLLKNTSTEYVALVKPQVDKGKLISVNLLFTDTVPGANAEP